MPRPQLSFVGHVTSAGVTNKVATVIATFQHFDKYLQRHFTRRQKFHISDPTNSLHTHDVVRFIYNPYISRSKRVTHVVTEILNPWGPTLPQRPPLLTAEELATKRALQVYKRGGEKAEKLKRGEFVITASGKLTATPPGDLGWKRFGGTLSEADMLEKATKDAAEQVELQEGSRPAEAEDTIWWMDKEGRRRKVQSETIKKVQKLMGEAVELGERAEKEVEEREAEGVDIDERMQGLRLSGGQAASV